MDSAVKIAVLEEQVKGIREQNKAQYDVIQNQLIDTKTLLSKLFTEMDELKESMNQGKGVFAASLTFAGVVGAAVSIGLQWLLSRN